MTYRAGMLGWSGGGGGGSPAWNAITGKPTAFAPSSHNHAISDVTGLQTALDGKQAAGVVASLVFHSDAGANVTLTNQVAGEQVLANSSRNESFFDATGFAQARQVLGCMCNTGTARLGRRWGRVPARRRFQWQRPRVPSVAIGWTFRRVRRRTFAGASRRSAGTAWLTRPWVISVCSFVKK